MNKLKRTLSDWVTTSAGIVKDKFLLLQNMQWRATEDSQRVFVNLSCLCLGAEDEFPITGGMQVTAT